jgi:hypothetical protein
VRLGADDAFRALVESQEVGASHQVVEFVLGERLEETHPGEATPYLYHR